ncbi:MAG: DUF4173 domain-containing protein [Anaerolineaceae bacterium]|nr:DUF4173 domain-containing protein [Anaerolineaceae bacterium]
MKNKFAKFWWVALVVAWFVDFLFWGKTPGISFPIWVAGFLVGMGILAWREENKPSKLSWILIFLALLTAALTSLRAEPFTRFTNGLFSIFLLGLLVMTFENGFWIYYRIVDTIAAGFKAAIGSVINPIQLLSSQSQTEEEQTDEDQVSSFRNFLKKSLPVLRGLLIAIPIVIILGALLASADPIFNDRMVEYLKVFDLKKLPEYFSRAIIILLLSFLISGFYIQVVLLNKKAKKPKTHSPWIKPFLGIVESAVVLSCVNALFLVFISIQFRYFFGGETNIHLSGYTYSEYAVRGFWELVFVSVLSLGLVLSLGTISKQKQISHRRIFSGLGIALLIQVFIILISAFQRLRLYESAYGFTRMRTYPHIFILCLGVLLIITIVLEGINKRGHFGLALIGMMFIFVLSLGFINVDQFIAARNIDRAAINKAPMEYDSDRGYVEIVDIDYFSELSLDIVPVLINRYKDENTSKRVHDLLGAELACREKLLEESPQEYWQSFHFSVERSRRLIEEHAVSWNQFEVQEEEDSYGWYFVEVDNGNHYCSYPYNW